MIQKLQKIFHTDKWWGKTLFIICFYLGYVILGYILIPLLLTALQGFNFGGYFIFGLLFLVFPIFSYYIPVYILKVFKSNKIILYVLHTLFIIIIPVVFILSITYLSLRNAGNF